jgi:hypothetical protein
MFVPLCARASGTLWNKNRLFCPILFRSLRVRAEQSGTNIGVFGAFSSKCAKDHVEVPSGRASAVVSTIKRITGCARRCAERLRLSALMGYAQSLRQLEA